MAKIFFISPVRQSTPESKEVCRRYVENLENCGHQVHWPIRDTDQSDPVGIKICDANLRKILEADEIHVWHLPTSTGIHFDLGATYMLIRILGYEKRVVFANRNEFTGEIGKLVESQRKDYLLVLDYLDKDTKKDGRMLGNHEIKEGILAHALKASEARAISCGADGKLEEELLLLNIKANEDANRFAEKHFLPNLRKILKRVQDTASSPYLGNVIDLGIEVEEFWPSGQSCDGSLKKKILAQKLIDALKQLGYKIELHTVKTLADCKNMDYAPEILISSWTVKW